MNVNVDSQQNFLNEYLDKTMMNGRKNVQDIITSIDPSATIDPSAESIVLDIIDDFIENLINLSQDLVSNKEVKICTKSDIEFIVKQKIGEKLPGSNKYYQLKPAKIDINPKIFMKSDRFDEG